MNIKEFEKELNRVEQVVTGLRNKLLESKADKKTYEVEVPDDIDDYYYTDEYGKVNYLEGYNSSYEKNKYIRGLAFKTEEEAEQYDKERILLFKLHKWAEEHNEGWTPNWEGEGVKWYVTYETDRNILKVNWCVCCRQFIKLPYFKSEELAREFIEKFGEEIIEVLC